MRFRLTLATLLATSLAGHAQAQRYPDRPIRMIVPFAPGGGTDIIARLVSLKLADAVPQPVIVDNRAGGGGIVGAELGAKATPDGYTLLAASATTLAVNPVLTKVGYDAKRDFAPVTQLGSQSHLLVVHPSIAANSVSEFVSLAKSRTTALNYGSYRTCDSVCQSVSGVIMRLTSIGYHRSFASNMEISRRRTAGIAVAFSRNAVRDIQRMCRRMGSDTATSRRYLRPPTFLYSLIFIRRSSSSSHGRRQIFCSATRCSSAFLRLRTIR